VTTVRAFVARHPVATYFVLTFVISWGGFLLAAGPGGFANTDWQTDARFPFAVLAMLSGPAVAGILLTVLLDGRAGLREILSRLLRWRVGAHWYAVALLPAPLLAAAVLFALSLSSPIFTTHDKGAVLLSGIAAGFSVVLEELGWTGFAVPRLRRRYGVVTTGLIVGVLWGAWHFLQGLYISDTYAGTLPLALFVALNSFGAIAQLTAYRVLLVWVYDRTGSLFIVTLMHASLTASTIFIFRPEAVGMSFLMYGWLLTALLWVLVGVVVLADSRHLSRKALRPAIPA
jgi:uncharacterized protein